MSKSSLTQSLFLVDCDRANTVSREAIDLVVLDWSGGVSPIYPNLQLAELDLGAFQTAEGNTLADYQDDFKARVRDQVAKIFCEWPDVTVSVHNAEDRKLLADTIVHLAQEIPPNGSTDIGEGEYDPCNQQNDNSAIVFGERLLQLSDTYTFDEWVLVFANVTAHEIAHTLGYTHATRLTSPDEHRGLYVELMLAGHSMAEMRREQRFLGRQLNCPTDPFAKRMVATGSTVRCGSPE